jgi:ABC-type molybdenum transport system ATPase subunit/photorepair protein PhrA
MSDNRQKSNLGNKILIIGCAGSGKTTLAKQLNKRWHSLISLLVWNIRLFVAYTYSLE